MKKENKIIGYVFLILALWSVFCFDNVPSVILGILVAFSMTITLFDGGQKDE